MINNKLKFKIFLKVIFIILFVLDFNFLKPNKLIRTLLEI